VSLVSPDEQRADAGDLLARQDVSDLVQVALRELARKDVRGGAVPVSKSPSMGLLSDDLRLPKTGRALSEQGEPRCVEPGGSLVQLGRSPSGAKPANLQSRPGIQGRVRCPVGYFRG
jgi:hypothetical protein